MLNTLRPRSPRDRVHVLMSSGNLVPEVPDMRRRCDENNKKWMENNADNKRIDNDTMLHTAWRYIVLGMELGRRNDQHLMTEEKMLE